MAQSMVMFTSDIRRASAIASIRRLGSLTVLIAAAAGCTSIPAGRYQALRAASEDVYGNVDDTYARIEKRQRDFVVLTAPDRPLSAETFTVRGQSFDISPELGHRRDALDALVKYTRALEAIAGKDYATDVDKSAQDLAASLRTLEGRDDSATISNAFGTVADLLARALTDSMRLSALKQAMDLGQPGVEALASLLQGSNKKVGAFVSIMQSRFVGHAQADRPKFGTWARYHLDLEIAATLDEFQQIHEALQTANAALAQLPQAHREIRLSLDNREQGLGALRHLIQEVKQLQKFYRNLPSN
ncbi:MAG: hypothetical protein WBO23_16895 [Burkholderiales bacterium]